MSEHVRRPAKYERENDCELDRMLFRMPGRETQKRMKLIDNINELLANAHVAQHRSQVHLKEARIADKFTEALQTNL